ncbi:MAG: hypothetical protein SFU56_01230 [Capsulimonadales bacterium]|nr:hypothetical protein [Capsulimonadales bacterium]
MAEKSETVPIPGNTYPVRAELKALGAVWDSEERQWRITPDKLPLARAIVDHQGKAAPESLTAAKRDAVKSVTVEELDDPFESEGDGPRQVPITGNTYPVKEALKALGATWDKDRRAWMIREEKAAYAQAIVRGETPSSGPAE